MCQSHIPCLLFFLLLLSFSYLLCSSLNPFLLKFPIYDHPLSQITCWVLLLQFSLFFLSHFNFSSPSYSFSFLRIVLLPCHCHFLVCSFVLCLSFIPPVPSGSLAVVLLFICLVLSWCFVCYPVLTYKHFLTMLLNRCSHFKLLLSELSPPIILLQIC